MFTGLIHERGRVSAAPVASGQGGVRLELEHSAELGARLSIGASLAVSGVCLTVTELQASGERCRSRVELAPETLSRTHLGALEEGSEVNLEPALRMGDPLGGHWVQGHVDGTVPVLSREDLTEHRWLTFGVPPDLAPYLVEKGSVTLDGVSLTVAARQPDSFTVTLIPHTLEVTNLARLVPGNRVHLEVDVLAKYVHQALASRGLVAGPPPVLKLPSQLPEPGRFWIRYTLACGPAPELWTDLAEGSLGRPLQRQPGLPGPLDDLVYLPPVIDAEDRDRQALRLLAAGTPVLVQLQPGETSPAVAAGAVPVYDLLAPLLARDFEALSTLPLGAAAVWPLVAGLTADPALWEEGCGRLGESGPRSVQALRLQLTPEARRRLVERSGEGAFEALFHGEPPAERNFARAAHRFGLAPFLPRPLPRPPFSASGTENRRLAGLLALAAELWLRLGRPEEPGQGLFRAARGADQTAYDLRALARDGNLGVLTWLDAPSRSLLVEALRSDRPALVSELLAEYLDEGGRSDES